MAQPHPRPPAADGALTPTAGPAEHPPSLRQPDDRLSLPFAARVPLATIVAAVSGLGLGLAHGTTEAGLRFRAEHAHKLPHTQAGWYMYHKSKNYNSMLGGIQEGLKMGFRTAVWAVVFEGAEEGVDRGRAALVRLWRTAHQGRPTARGPDHEDDDPDHDHDHDHDSLVAGNRDFASTMLAGLGTAGAFSAWNRFPLPTAVRVAKMGAKAGLAFGLAQDALAWLRGRKLGYVEFAKRRVFGAGADDDENAQTTATTPVPG